MADTRRPVSQIYSSSRQPSLQVYPERYEHDDSDNDSISEESAFTARVNNLAANERFNHNHNHPYQQSHHSTYQQMPQQSQGHMRPAATGQKARPMSYPNFNSSGSIIPNDFILPLPPQPHSSHHSRSSSHESLSNALSKEISLDREEQVKEGIDIFAIKTKQLQEKAKSKPKPKAIPQPQYIEIDSPVIETSSNIPSLPASVQVVQKNIVLPQHRPEEEYQKRQQQQQQTEDEYRLPTPEMPKSSSNRNSFQLELSLASPDLSSLMSEFSQISFQQSQPTTSLGRKNTITSPNANIKTSPSKTAPAVFERMRSLRKSHSKENFNIAANQQQQQQQPKQLQPAPVAVKKQPSVETVAVTRRADPKPFAVRPTSIITTQPEAVAKPAVVPVQVPITEYRSLDPDATRRVVHEAELKQLFQKTSVQQDPNQFDDAIEEEQIEIEDESEPVIVDGPTVSSPVVSVYSFDAHMVNQLCAIPSPIMNAISFTPPIGSAPDEDDEETSEMDSIFSKNVDKKKDEEGDSVFELTPEDIPTVSKFPYQCNSYHE
jgi:hypothetical protein